MIKNFDFYSFQYQFSSNKFSNKLYPSIHLMNHFSWFIVFFLCVDNKSIFRYVLFFCHAGKTTEALSMLIYCFSSSFHLDEKVFLFFYVIFSSYETFFFASIVFRFDAEKVLILFPFKIISFLVWVFFLILKREFFWKACWGGFCKQFGMCFSSRMLKFMMNEYWRWPLVWESRNVCG